MGIQIECYTTDMTGAECVLVSDDVGFTNFYVSHAEFKAACCRDLGLVDPDVQLGRPIRTTPFWAVNRSEDRTQFYFRSTAADVLAAASRRLA